jgi:hypothetical protein
LTTATHHVFVAVLVVSLAMAVAVACMPREVEQPEQDLLIDLPAA